jgi:hypothetical protein
MSDGTQVDQKFRVRVYVIPSIGHMSHRVNKLGPGLALWILNFRSSTEQ